ncbi:HEAT repeat domain-containing protein [Planctomycetes bacterium K23_9]|uniref:HEAT repeat protein n=1 Tax=Stieleria marina TaxID=1930275 RepID=A0A517NWY4_9BACT|nr:hypothetical protein K239x_36290 [Planctomycetes bacterium K23_9]
MKLPLSHFFEPTPTFLYRGKRYSVQGSGRFLIATLMEVDAALRQGRSLLSLRKSITQAGNSVPPVLACYLMHHSSDPIWLRMLIRMLGKSREHSATWTIFILRNHQDPKIRLAVVRSLRQLAAWKQLSQIASKGQYENSRFAAAQVGREDFDRRLKAFTMSLCQVQPGQTKQAELFVASEAITTGGKSPRNQQTIRAVLRKIRRMIRRSQLRRRRCRQMDWCSKNKQVA